ncbi:MAG: 1-acyl-sn-glycerol-3-phosphate acyltransferase [Patescibacteria group bacterium]|nr:1-acyl-sn-glycerol-3-phosphate acyltransferase [Patescibacteria group bacterium]
MFETILYKLGKTFIKVYAVFAFKVKVKIEGKLPAGPKIYVANHPSTTDPFLSVILIKEQVRILVKGIIFQIPFFGFYLKHSGHIPVIPKQGAFALEKAKETLLRGQSLVIFIEGKISPDKGQFSKPKTGAVRLALQTGFPLIPLGLGLEQDKIKALKSKIKEIDEIGKWYFKGKYTITFGKPIYVKGDCEDRKNTVRLTNLVMKKVIHAAQESQKQLLLAV